MELLLVSYRELGDSLGEAEVSEPIPVDDARTTLETGPGGSLYFAARQQSRWKLFAISPPDQRQETPTALRRLPSWAALSVSGERLLVLTRGALLIVFPLASNSGASAHSISPGGLTNGGFAHLAVAGSGRNPGDTAWIAHGTDLRRVSLDTGAEAARLRLSGAILAADLDGGDLFALIAPDGEPTKRQLIRLKVP